MENIVEWWGWVITRAVITVGVIDWAKGFVPAAPKWALRVMVAGASVAVAVAGGGGIGEMATVAAGILAVSQVGYPVLVQLPSAGINRLRERLGGK